MSNLSVSSGAGVAAQRFNGECGKPPTPTERVLERVQHGGYFVRAFRDKLDGINRTQWERDYMDYVGVVNARNLSFSTMLTVGMPLFNVIKELLLDRTTNRNIVWATANYTKFNPSFRENEPMFEDKDLQIIYNGVMCPRVQRCKDEQQRRTKAKAEVFTPSWICNKMNNLCDEYWFGVSGVFNTENADNTWTPTQAPISFTAKKTWQKYVDSRRLEITCGEAPYLVSRYDTTTGEYFEPAKRIGILDRKLRVINENTDTFEDWWKWVQRAYEATYGYEYQGDNLLFARVNMVQTFIDYYIERYNDVPADKYIKKIATIVSWNLWQMDGLKDTVPYVPATDNNNLMILELLGVEETQPREIFSKIKDWRSNKVVEFRSLKEGV